MAWYKTGTISITAGQTSVTGVNTKFASNSKVGDGLRAPDGKWYEIVNIASETVFGIFPTYAGPTVSASVDWMIAPLQGYNQESARLLRAITDSIPTSLDGKQDKNTNLTAFSNLVGAADRLPYFSGVGALQLTTLTSKARELLAQTTEANMLNWLSGENTLPLNGTASTDLNTLRTKRTDYYISNGTNTPTGGNGYLTVIPLSGTTECYQRYTLVSGVGSYERVQISGNWGNWNRFVTPDSAVLDPALNTGGLMFYSSNANGDFYKFANGLLICTRIVTNTDTVNAAATGLFIGSTFNWTFPLPFVTAPFFSGSAKAPNSVSFLSTNFTTSTVSSYFNSALTSLTSRDYVTYLLAVGRWK